MKRATVGAFSLAVAAFSGSLITNSRFANHFVTQMLAVMGLVATVLLGLLLRWYFNF